MYSNIDEAWNNDAAFMKSSDTGKKNTKKHEFSPYMNFGFTETDKKKCHHDECNKCKKYMKSLVNQQIDKKLLDSKMQLLRNDKSLIPNLSSSQKDWLIIVLIILVIVLFLFLVIKIISPGANR
jgi:hypothetical protein